MNTTTKFDRRTERDLAGKEIFEIHPIILGGNPTDPRNKTVLTREDHIKAVNYWNNIIRGHLVRESGAALKTRNGGDTEEYQEC